jgi:AraC-like DNA-binding protein
MLACLLYPRPEVVETRPESGFAREDHLQEESGACLRFSTDDLPERDRLPVWREAFGRTIVKMDMEPIGDAPFRSRADIQMLPNLSIALVSSSPNRVTRTPQLIADGSDDLVFGILLGGEAVAHQGEKEVRFRAGEALLWSNDAPGGCVYHSSIDFLALAVSRVVLAQAVVNFDDALMQLVPRNNAAMRLLTGYVKTLQGEIGHMSPELKAVSAAHVQDLVALALGATGDAAHIARGRGVRVARLRALKAYILANFTRRDLSIETVARRHGISPRYIRTLFDSDQTTFTDFVLNQRLARAHRCLIDPRFVGHMISTIAFEAGFGDLSYFNHVFRRRYNATPSDIRAAARKDDTTV